MPPTWWKKYRGAVMSAMDDPGVRNVLTRQGIILRSSTPAELARLASDESDVWARGIRRANIKPE
jgi:tripartite-type tricarboxylate transporter receptor subunit TctC